MQTWLILAVFALGVLLGKPFNLSKKPTIYLNKTINLSIFLLLFLLGASVGNNHEIIKNFLQLGIQSIVISMGAIAGSLLLLWLVQKPLFSKTKTKNNQ